MKSLTGSKASVRISCAEDLTKFLKHNMFKEIEYLLKQKWWKTHL